MSPTPDPTANAVKDRMWQHDAFSQWLGLEIETCAPGYCRLHFLVRPEMQNGFGMVHGGVLFSAADSALAFASNSHGRLSVVLQAAIDFLETGRVGEVLYVEAREESLKYKVGVYQIRMTREDGTCVALFKGTVYRTSQEVLAT
ncbi:acyl-CoA thioesterase [Catalinimonas alkaloidigena]|uniref:Acyl-CoA thioesterase n=1 Tax=Catalinimonas alkaloidigena TaxID=1075417 RepID=A0A1G9H9Y1_9BACT|nr:hotdog fold thioesterase [Catalinimonas alkaloidigena]SDL09692.1 acyl-CoA thioesterase [Catalinimonas alkaloidigena]